MAYQPRTALGRAVHGIEETLIAVILGLMTLVTFANVIARYGFNSNILWALEMTSFLFSWLVLLGASYAVKVSAHLGVDAILNMLGRSARRTLGLVAAGLCILYAFLLLKGGWDYWAPFVNLQPTSGRFFPTGFESVRGQAWYEVNDIDMPGFLNPLFANLFNEGEPYEKLPRLIPYAVLPFSMALLLWRFIEAFLRVLRGEEDMIIASHEAEDLVEEAAAKADKEN